MVKTEKEVKDLGFIHLYVVSGSIEVYGKGNERYYCEHGIVKYHVKDARPCLSKDRVDFVW